MVLPIEEEMHFSNVELLSEKRTKFFSTTRGLFISAMSHVKLIAETRVYVCHKNMKHEMYGYFVTVLRKFSRKSNKKYLTGNEEWIKSETASLTGDYVLRIIS